MSKTDFNKLKLAAKALRRRLKEEQPRVLVQDWHKDSQSRARVKAAVEEVLDRELPDSSYNNEMFRAKCDEVFDRIYRYAAEGEKWAA